jgi:peptidoglycan/xylan/chitin deacetylase (PgdA/CDA1 family)
MNVKIVNNIYYSVKPLIPRRLQIALRRYLVLKKMDRFSHVWPIDETAARPPDNWRGWPDGKQFALVLLHDVETELGHSKCRQLIKLEEEMGFRSSFNFVPERYDVSPDLRREVVERGFEVGVHGLRHDGKLFLSRKKFSQHAISINHYLKEWQSVGFCSPSMHRNLEWNHELDIEYDASTFDTDPFEPQPEGMATIFPFFVHGHNGQRGYIELPYTLPQDFTLFVLMRERDIDIWKRKLDWIAEKGGMALLITHSDYMSMDGMEGKCKRDEYPMAFYERLLDYVKSKYEGQYWHALPSEVARFWRGDMVPRGKAAGTSVMPRSTKSKE